MQSSLTFAGIGSRITPPDVLDQMTIIASILYKKGYVLRSGGADGADSAFELGAGDKKEIYLPWKGFNDKEGIVAGNKYAAKLIAEEFHPYWDNMTQGGKKLHTRNVCQILGADCKTPCEFVICWTPRWKSFRRNGPSL